MTTETGASVGFIGLGDLGLPILARLVSAERSVVAVDINAARIDLARARLPGFTVATGMRPEIRELDTVFLCVATTAQSEQILLGEAGLWTSGAQASVVNLSTIDPDTSRHLQATGRARGARYLEAPVIGSVAHAEEGKLVVLAAGDSDLLTKVTPLLRSFCVAIHELAEPGWPSTIKLCQNGLGLIHAAAICEVLGICAASGVPVKAFVDIVGAAPGIGNSPLFRTAGRRIAEGDFEPGARLRIAGKDVALFRDLAAALGTPSDMAATAAAAFARAEAIGLGEKDLTALIEVFGTVRG